jgi:uncharacterized integral membrane protein (TIGR00698 family)
MAAIPLPESRLTSVDAAGRRLLPGLLISLLVASLSVAIAAVETRVLGHPVIEALVVALLLGMALRLVWTPRAAYGPGIRFASKDVLEVAVLLLGVSVDLPLLMRAGPALALAIVGIVIVGLAIGVGIGRTFGLPAKLAILVACGNAICGNSAIAAVAPVIGADAEDVASSIAFTAILGVIVVLALPLVIGPLALSHYQYGVLAGLTVYAVPQVLAAAFPVSALSGEIATLVKLVRVLMLGPVVLFFALHARRARSRTAVGDHSLAYDSRGRPAAVAGARSPSLASFVPWFIIGFLMLAAARVAGLIPPSWVAPTRLVSSYLTVLAMAGLGLSADVRAVARAGARVSAAVSASLLVLVALGVAIIRVLHIR